ncbi:DMT family transporter [Photobacterium sp. 1_MG-2023]|uniref:DMT family transporter n=1 Tax=Photobacterium sp. 1_MG-2023 TaxID=3062646 RepID=UPI0026E1DE86|nr:DMT family transporter [Photobacterium sp. 1_MG-2023]MDO6708455.1 DMT family transporter [Photobacterium sp. 1_MG-2023]
MNTSLKVLLLTSLAMLFFAANSLLNRVALSETQIDPASFTLLRIASGALFLWLILSMQSGINPRFITRTGHWPSAAALFIYAAGFSFAYESLTAATGALLLFAAVQITLMTAGWCRGERLTPVQLAGFALALGGLVVLLLPGVSAPAWDGAILMVIAGVSWGFYTLLGKGSSTPLQTTSGNFLRAVPLAMLCWFLAGDMRFDGAGILYAVLSGAIASGIGYAIWYQVLPSLTAMTAATIQLSVPVLAALGGVFFLSEAVSFRLMMASAAILGGIAIVLRYKSVPRQQ